MKKVLAWAMLVGSVIGIATSVWPFHLYATQEPKVVLGLSWLALLFSAVDAIFIEHES